MAQSYLDSEMMVSRLVANDIEGKKRNKLDLRLAFCKPASRFHISGCLSASLPATELLVLVPLRSLTCFGLWRWSAAGDS